MKFNTIVIATALSLGRGPCSATLYEGHAIKHAIKRENRVAANTPRTIDRLEQRAVRDATAISLPLRHGKARLGVRGGSAALSEMKSIIDTGVLDVTKHLEDRHLEGGDSCHVSDVIVCDNGLTTSGYFLNGTDAIGQTCKVACEGQCCVGGIRTFSSFGESYAPACEPFTNQFGTPRDGFTGSVCKDGISCFGHAACTNANVPSIFHGCNGTRSCYKAGSDGGSVGNIVQSCYGEGSCFSIGGGGSVGNVTNSCRGEYSCERAGYSGGYVGSITGSCFQYRSCQNAGRGGGYVGSILDSCLEENSCTAAGSYGGYVGSISGSCGQVRSCYNAGLFNGEIGSIYGSCGEYKSCYQAARSKGKIGSISDSCNNGTYACAYAGFYSEIASIEDSCNNERSCEKTAMNTSILDEEELSCIIFCSFYPAGYPGYNITTGIINCCNTAGQCENITSAPDTCGTVSPSSSPTQQPTVTLTQQPTEGPTVSPSPPPTNNPSSSPLSSSPTSSPTIPAKINAATFVRKNVRRRLDEFDEASNECVLVVANVTAGLVEDCLASEEQVLNVATLDVSSLENDELLRFVQELEIGGESSSPASRLNDLQACVDKSVTDGNAKDTLQANAPKGGCSEFEGAIIERLVLTSADDPTTEAPTSAAPNGTPSGPSVQTKSPSNSDTDTSAPTSAAPNGTPVSLAPSGPSVQTKSPSDSDTNAPTLAPVSSTKSSKASGKRSKTNSNSTTSAKSDNKSKASSKASSKSSKKSIEVEGEEPEETAVDVPDETAKVEEEEQPTEAIEETAKDKVVEKSFINAIIEVVGNVFGVWGR